MELKEMQEKQINILKNEVGSLKAKLKEVKEENIRLSNKVYWLKEKLFKYYNLYKEQNNGSNRNNADDEVRM